MEEIPVNNLSDPQNPEWTLQTTIPFYSDTLYFVLTAVDNYGFESDYSNEVSRPDTSAPGAPSVSGTTPTSDTTPTWSWSPGGGGNGTYRYKLDNSDLSTGATQTSATSYTPAGALTAAAHTLYVQERDAVGNWSGSGSFTIVIDTSAPVIKEAMPYHNAGIIDNARVSIMTSFYVRIEDADGIDITDPNSIWFTIYDSVHAAYTRNLLDTIVVRVIKLSSDDDTSVTKLLAVYDRSKESVYGG